VRLPIDLKGNVHISCFIAERLLLCSGERSAVEDYVESRTSLLAAGVNMVAPSPWAWRKRAGCCVHPVFSLTNLMSMEKTCCWASYSSGFFCLFA
jgi:hypothetical protein